MSQKVINFDTARKALNNDRFESHVLAKVQEAELNRWWFVRRESDQFDDHQFNLLFFRDLDDVLHLSDPEQHKHKLLIPLYQYLDYIQINSEHSEKLLEGFFYDSYTTLDVQHCPAVGLGFISQYPDKNAFITDQLSWHGFYQNDVVPIYLVNKQGELENQESGYLPHCDLYVEFEYTEFIELVFRSYSLFVERGEFAKAGFLSVWQRYLELMQEHATADNLEEIHRTYWLSLCPEISNLANTTQSVN